MRVLILNTSEKTGGAAVAANRLMEALNNNGVKAKMLVRDKETDCITVVGLRQSLMQQWRFLWERWVIFWHLHFSRKHLFEVDIANSGTDITRMREFKEADVIHLHWINQGFLSLKTIRRILESGKPVVWTMHDIWPATGICHITHDCKRFQTACRNCRYLGGGAGDNDFAYKTWNRKRKMLDGQHLNIVACSQWLAGEARKSALLAGQSITSIPNPIDTRFTSRKTGIYARQTLGLPLEKRIVLFAAQRATNVNKGMGYLVDACKMLAQNNPEMVNDTCVAILGGHAEEVMAEIPFEAFPLGYTSDTSRIIDVYNASDVFVLPSLSENLPNTIMEAMACGVPCVGFKVGGIPEMIDHKRNGYVAKFRDAADLAAGIHWVLNEADKKELSDNCQKKVAACYSPQAVALRYIEVYNQALAFKHYKI